MTIDTSREAVERLLDGVTEGPWAWEENHPLNACASVTAETDAGWTIGIATLYGDSDDVPTPTEPDEPWGDHPIRRADARFIAAARDLVPALLAERDAALAEVARLSHAHAAERKLADDLAAELVLAEIDVDEAEDKFRVASFYIKDDQALQCFKDREVWMAKAGRRIRDAIAAHAARRKE